VLWCDKGPLEHPIHRSAESIRHLTWIDRVGRQFRLLYEPCPALPSPSHCLLQTRCTCKQACPPVLLITINNSTLHRIPELINSFIYRASYQTYCCTCTSVDQRLSFSCWLLFVLHVCELSSSIPVGCFWFGFFPVHSVAVKVYQSQAINASFHLSFTLSFSCR